MNLIKKTDSLFPNIPSLFDNMFGSDHSEFWPANFSEGGRSFPAVNILESDSMIVRTACSSTSQHLTGA